MTQANAYATYVVDQAELTCARRLYDSIRVFDKATPFWFCCPDVSELSFRFLKDLYPFGDYNVAEMRWPEPGIPYKTLWQLPHTIAETSKRVMLLPFNAVISNDLSWLFEKLTKYTDQLKAAVAFGVNALTEQALPNVCMFDSENGGTWEVFELIRDMRVSTWNEGAWALLTDWHTVRDVARTEPSLVMRLYPLRFQVISSERVSGLPPNVLVDGLPTVENLIVTPRGARWPHL